ncbi:phytanoyl-CoA dioxygenase family protein [Paraburkholderia caribensis]|uniref:phytanoyl-CoA dioxygenase family protein n=1 Tax=Paraburkholderia caribensis TaxID=75105 RepID=UPI00285E0FE1|nr:phytanoyl-CoA dioxygenase family protein [Paraburkholderia caribensis]MDR6383862.1 ectoine hydroxylase-related dioxygenase (phytanoyl-CoA dioxygenase family) [Paraburkholderia caribensis]
MSTPPKLAHAPVRKHDTYGVVDRLGSSDATDEAIAELRVNGYTVLDSGLSPDFVESLREGLERAYARQIEEIGNEEMLRAMNDADIARCMLAYETDFLTVATTAPLLEFAKRALGPEFVLLMQNGILNRPDRENYQARWHRDLNYQHWTSSKTLAINALLCIDPFTIQNGATYVLPGTHHVAQFPTDAFASKFETQIEAPAGSYLILDAMLYHRAGINQSKNVRRAVNHVIGLPFMAQQIDLPAAMASKGIAPPKDPAIAKYLGYRWSPASDVAAWRSRRIDK